VVPRAELKSATRWLAERIALNDLLSLKLSKMSVNQAADIMGVSAAVRASGNFWIIGSDPAARRPMQGNSNSRVNWSKEQNARFDAHEKKGKRPWRGDGLVLLRDRAVVRHGIVRVVHEQDALQ